MKIMQINATYGYGSTGSMVRDLHRRLLAAGEESYVCWATRCTEISEEDIHVCQIGSWIDHKLHALSYRLFHNQGWNSRLATYCLCKKIQKLEIQIVHLHNLHSNYIHLPMLLRFLARQHIKTVVTLHDCWFFTGHCTHFLNQNNCQQWNRDMCAHCPVYKRKSRIQNQIFNQFREKKTSFESIDRLAVVGVSDWITGRGRNSLLAKADPILRIYNWIDCQVFSPKQNRNDIRQKYGVPDGKALILGVSQGWSQQKGVAEFQRISDVLSQKAVVILVGECGSHASTESLKFVGYTKNAEDLADLYSAADVFVNPSRMETFGKVTAEALACGTPVVAYDNTGTSELVTDAVGRLVEDGNVDQLLLATEYVLSKGKQAYCESCRNHASARFQKDIQLQAYMDLYSALQTNDSIL